MGNAPSILHVDLSWTQNAGHELRHTLRLHYAVYRQNITFSSKVCSFRTLACR